MEHFCISLHSRNKGIGAKALESLCRRGKSVVLEIDPPVDEVSSRREQFYLRCGFFRNSYPHIHPPYHAGFEGHSLTVMSYPQPMAPQAYARFQEQLSSCVMAK